MTNCVSLTAVTVLNKQYTFCGKVL